MQITVEVPKHRREGRGRESFHDGDRSSGCGLCFPFFTWEALQLTSVV